MGVDISGGMIVGRIGSDMESKDEEMELWEWAEENGMDHLSLYYDSDEDDRIYGFTVQDVFIKDIDNWVVEVKRLSEEFKELTGLEAKLYGSQDIT